MIRYRIVAALLAMALVVSLPLAAVAQAGPSGPEGTAWKLTSYHADDELTAVPFGVSASLLLETGRASAFAWATRSASSDSTQLTSITEPIEQPGERCSPSCPT